MPNVERPQQRAPIAHFADALRSVDFAMSAASTRTARMRPARIRRSANAAPRDGNSAGRPLD
ncbi:hypothetical protein C7S16_3766 [Burkholderia thailandensis]|uniref:Peptidase S50 domain-containing protein n=1 Tax=Burkholderia thailandensis TaxID=57975 RepID=A0AAW9D104_BURTH|nr:hypothetical protein [Burkholderia thailandensis]MDW9254943.1 hypothetical protein [Burkholderia thailandensis]